MRPTCVEERGRRHAAAVYLILWLLCMPPEVDALPSSRVIVDEGPTSGVAIEDTQGMLLTQPHIVSQVVYIDLSPELIIEQHISKSMFLSDTIKTWYRSHIIRTRNSIRKILSQLENRLITEKNILSVLSTMFNTNMKNMNYVSVKEIDRKLHNLRHSIGEIQQQLESQRVPNDEIFNVVNQTVVIQGVHGLHTEMFMMPISLHQKLLDESIAFLTFVEPVSTITHDYLRELEFTVNDLINLQIPLFILSTDILQAILSKLHNVNPEDFQFNASLMMGCAIPMFLDIEKLHLSFLLKLPLFKRDNFYLTKKVINVGTWKGDIYIKSNTPQIIANPYNIGNVYHVPKIDSCSVFNNLNYVCPEKPFISNANSVLCGLRSMSDRVSVCDVTVSRPKISDFNTVAVIVQNRWLVSSRHENITIYYLMDGGVEVWPLKHRVSLITVPKDVTVFVGDQTLYHISSDAKQDSVEMINGFSSDKIPIDESLKFLLRQKDNHKLKLSITKDQVDIAEHSFSHSDLELLSLQYYHNVQLSLQIAILIFVWCWLLILTVYVAIHHRSRIRFINKEYKTQEQAWPSRREVIQST